MNRGVRAAVTASSAGDRSAAPHSPVLNTPATEPAGAGLAVAKPDEENADVPPPGATASAGLRRGVSPSCVTASSGSQTRAVRPPEAAGRSRTLMPCRAASRATTNRPMRRETATSTTGGLSSRQLACAISSAPMPTPWSVMSSSTPPLLSRWPDTFTGVSAEENEVAFSASSEIRWTTSLTAGPRTEMPGCTFSVTRSYCSISDTAARSTSTSGTGWFRRRDTSWPARTRRFSELRRIRVARWSIWNRLDSRSASCSPSSSSSISWICRSTRDWLRRDRLTNIALTLPRSAASLDASRSASR